MKSILLLFIAFTFTSAISDISMLNIKIHDSKNVLEKIKLSVISQEENIVKYETKNKNAFSVTTDDDKVVYMENDWLQKEEGRKPLYTDFTFGKTTLRDVRNKFGTNGFTFKSRQAFATDDDLIEFNCFEFDSSNDEVLVVITKVALNEENITEENVADKLKLDALIIADKEYLNKTWGDEKIFDSNYKKIKL